jgi:hypothetical protein
MEKGSELNDASMQVKKKLRLFKMMSLAIE